MSKKLCQPIKKFNHAGTVEWVDRLKWANATKYQESDRMGLGVEGVLEGYYKKYDKFAMYWALRSGEFPLIFAFVNQIIYIFFYSGHMVPADNPAVMGAILRSLTNYG
jgi:carboxypeptidase C (cathepsin A)